MDPKGDKNGKAIAAPGHDTQSWRMPRDAPALRAWIRRSSSFLKRRKHALAVMLGILILADLTLVIAWPSTYQATASVAIEPACLPENVTSLVPSVTKRVSRLTSQTLSDASLTEIVHQAHLKMVEPGFLRTLLEPEPSSRVQRLRERIALNVAGGAEGSPIIIIKVTGEHAKEVADVATRLQDKLVKLDADFRRGTAAAVRDAVKAEAVIDEGPLAKVESQLEQFRKECPQVAIASDEAIRAQQTDLETKALEDQVAQAELEATLPGLKTEAERRREAVWDEADLARRAALAQEQEKASAKAAQAAQDDPRRAYLAELERDLFKLRARCTEQNPDVKRKIAEIEKERERLGEEPLEPGAWNGPRAGSSPSSAPASDSGGKPGLPQGSPSESGPGNRPDERRPDEQPKSEPPRDGEKRVGALPRRDDGVRLVADRPEGGLHAPAGDARFLIQAPSYSAWREAEARYESGKSRLEALKARAKQREPVRRDLTELVKALPAKRLQFSQLVSERERLSRGVEEARVRQKRTQRAYEIEVGEAKDGARPERLAFVDTPQVPEAPLGPDRPFAFLACLGVSIFLALGTAYVRDVRDRSLHTGDEATAALELPVLGVIPRLRGRR